MEKYKITIPNFSRKIKKNIQCKPKLCNERKQKTEIKTNKDWEATDIVSKSQDVTL